jgi:hypothetical protein
MLKRYANLIALGVLSVVLMLGLIFSLYYATHPNRKPAPQTPAPSQPAENAHWYIRFSVRQQKVTAYTEEAGAPRAANGKNYYIGGIAVHPRYPVTNGGNPVIPILPFGTVIHFKEPIKIQGTDRSSLTVIDTGDVNYRLWSSHPYWFDIFWGSTNYYNSKSARDFGARLVDYYWYEPWK